MSSFTRRAILDAFLRILAKKPFRKITVRDIVEACEVNRTTFYYYFQDIYAIVEELAASMMAPYAAALGGNPDEEALRDVSDFVRMHRRALRNLWDGIGEEEIRRYLGSELDGAITECIERLGEGLSVKNEGKRAISLFMKETLLGFFRLFLRGELPEERIWVSRGLFAAAQRMLIEMSNEERGDRE